MTTTKHDTGSALAIRDNQTSFNEQQVAALRHVGAESAGPGDLAVFFHQAQRTGLDPFARQIYLVGRDTWDARTRTSTTKYTIQTGIDGFRLVARRASDAARESFGYEDTLWCDANGQWTDVWLSENPPAAAKVTVIRNGQRFPAVALFREYAGTKKDGGLTKMWAEKGALMIAKCAEALALRKAFPQDLSGLYTADEMSRADHATVTQTRPAALAPSTSLADAMAAEPVAAEIVITLDDVGGCASDSDLRALWEATTPADVAIREAISQRHAELFAAAQDEADHA